MFAAVAVFSPLMNVNVFVNLFKQNGLGRTWLSLVPQAELERQLCMGHHNFPEGYLSDSQLNKTGVFFYSNYLLSYCTHMLSSFPARISF